MDMREMVDCLNQWAYRYYVLDDPSVPDTEYDALYDRLVLLEKQTGVVFSDSPTKRVGGEPLKNFKQHTHLNRLYSLDKAQSFNELASWVEKINKTVGKAEFTVELKYDGLTISATYENGNLICAATRGNGIVGEDVTEQVKTIRNVPLSIPYKGKIEIQGEGIMRLSQLNRYNEKNNDNPLKNARNAAAGAIRNLDPKVTAKRNLDVVFYSNSYNDDLGISKQTQLVEFLKDCRFSTNYVFETASNFEQIKEIIETIAADRSKYDFLIDGVVIKVNDFEIRERLGYTDKFPKWAVAYKFDAEQVITKLLDVDWQVGRTGKLTPTANLEAVELCGATIKRATLNNYGDIVRKNLLLNSYVFLRRSNDVIPEVLGLAEKTTDSSPIAKPKVCPACGSTLEEVGAHLFCPNKNGCRPQIVARLTHYCSKPACDIDGISEKTIWTLHQALGISNPVDLYFLDKDKLHGLDGFQEKKITNLLSSIEKSKSVSLPNYIYALGIGNIGSVTAKDLAAKFKNIDAIAKADIETLSAVDQIGDVVAQSIADYFADCDNVRMIAQLKEIGIDPQYAEKSNTGVFSGKKVVLTGSLETLTRSQASQYIAESGGEVASGISKSVNLVIAGRDAGSKLAKAQALAIEIIDEQQFLQMLGKTD
ncbi:MAG: NAD-dependent DNA ligase LigA [Corallococcus sp.]|nr:NAD-dependent DNA ligase LigA [Corallococcus sp.]